VLLLLFGYPLDKVGAVVFWYALNNFFWKTISNLKFKSSNMFSLIFWIVFKFAMLRHLEQLAWRAWAVS
jgi:hypothetical protein